MMHQALNTATHRSAFVRISLTAAIAALLAVSANAQGRGPGGGMGGGMGGFGGGRSSMGGENRTPVPYSTGSRGGLQLGPTGRWWDNKEFARTIGLDSRQQKRLDDVFGENKDNLLKLYKGLQHEESQLEKLTRSRELDENQIFQQIDRVTQARGELEKANAHMLLQIRKELTPDQTARLDELRPQPAQ
jgi:Spy/CpxP family protein refolding chaperone